jgi:hypothetical protein
MSVTGAAIVEKALSFKGQHEVGDNEGPFVEACQNDTFHGGTGWPWCAAFVCHVAKLCGVPLAYNSAGAHDLADHHEASRQSIDSARPGDVCDWVTGEGHTSILVAKGPPGSWTTIDGNWGDAVAEPTHPVSELRKVWRIPGVDNTPPARKPKIPVYTIATSHNGHRKLLFVTKHEHGGKKRVAHWIVRHTLAKVAPNGITIKRAKRRI